MRVILMHGKSSDPSEKWYPWFITKLQSRNIEIHAPALPDANDPDIQEWTAELSKLQPDENTIVVGHSRGGVAVMRYLEKAPPELKLAKVILVATNSGHLGKMAIPTEGNKGFYTIEGYDFPKIKSHSEDFVVFHSKDDPWVPFSAGEENASGLSARFEIFQDKLHFGRNLPEFPELLAEI